jgi:hypothetical protein
MAAGTTYRLALVDYGDPTALLGSGERCLLPCGATAKHDEVVFLRLLRLFGHGIACLPKHHEHAPMRQPGVALSAMLQP